MIRSIEEIDKKYRDSRYSTNQDFHDLVLSTYMTLTAFDRMCSDIFSYCADHMYHKTPIEKYRYTAMKTQLKNVDNFLNITVRRDVKEYINAEYGKEYNIVLQLLESAQSILERVEKKEA